MVFCITCEHHCHCFHKCELCDCETCEHPNALDEFWKRLEENAAAIINLTKHKD
jgi:hypothetical protein